jgi:hypothetical protein
MLLLTVGKNVFGQECAVMIFWNPCCGENFVQPQTRCYDRPMTLAAQGLKLENFTVVYALLMAACLRPSVQEQRISRSVHRKKAFDIPSRDVTYQTLTKRE